MKDPFNIFIEDSVLYASNEYYKLINKTKLLFFECLNNNKPVSYFKDEARKIWGKVDHSYMEERIKELESMVSAKNLDGHSIINPNATFEEVFKLEPESKFIVTEKKYENTITNFYKGRLKTIENGFVDKEIYLTELVKKYDKKQAIIPYFNKDGTIRSYHNIASYNSMVYNTNMNRAGWNRTIYDSKLVENDLVYLPAHSGACPLCSPWQGKVYSVSGATPGYPLKDSAIAGGIGHPNCKHQWTIYWNKSQIQENKYNSASNEEYYINKQKLQALELKRTNLKVDKNIYKEVGNMEEYDKVNSSIQRLNSEIKELKSHIN